MSVKSQDEDHKAPMPFEEESLHELEWKIDLAEKNLQFIKEYQELEFENQITLSDLEAKLSLDYGDFIRNSLFVQDCIRSCLVTSIEIISITRP